MKGVAGLSPRIGAKALVFTFNQLLLDLTRPLPDAPRLRVRLPSCSRERGALCFEVIWRRSRGLIPLSRFVATLALGVSAAILCGNVEVRFYWRNLWRRSA